MENSSIPPGTLIVQIPTDGRLVIHGDMGLEPPARHSFYTDLAAAMRQRFSSRPKEISEVISTPDAIEWSYISTNRLENGQTESSILDFAKHFVGQAWHRLGIHLKRIVIAHHAGPLVFVEVGYDHGCHTFEWSNAVDIDPTQMRSIVKAAKSAAASPIATTTRGSFTCA